MHEIIFFLCFLSLVVLLLALDLGVFHKKDHIITFKEASIWTAIWICMAFLFYGFICIKGELIHAPETIEQLQELNTRYGHNLNFDNITFEEGIKMYRHALSLEYLTSYLIEKALSLDNIFVMIMLFIAFGVNKQYYHRVLFFGIIGAIVLRFIFIFTASALIQRFHWIMILFGGILIYSGIKMYLERNKKETIDVARHPIVKFLSKYKLSTSTFSGHNFFTKENGKWLMTPLFIVLLIIELSDIVFAFDSIPAIFSITQDPFIVFFSNIFAILGLRSLFFMLESVIDKFYYLKIGLAILLSFIGIKMLLPYISMLPWVHHTLSIDTRTSLLAVVLILSISILFSVLCPPKHMQASQNHDITPLKDSK